MTDQRDPQTSAIPQSMEEALRVGFEICDEESSPSADELTRKGTISMKKEAGPGLDLYISIPFIARYEYGEPSFLKIHDDRPQSLIPRWSS